MKHRKYVAIALSISVAILSLSGCSLEKVDATSESQEYSISLPTEMPSVSLAEDDGSIPDLESLEARGNEAEGNKEGQENGSSEIPTAEATPVAGLPTASPSSSHEEDGDGPDPTAEPSTGGEGGLPTASPTATPGATVTPTQTPAATQTPTPQQTTSPQATQTPSTTQTPQATQTPQSTATPTATQQPQATQTPSGGGSSEAHQHNWQPKYVISSDYLGNCQWQDDVMWICYGCGQEKQEKSNVYTSHHQNYESGLNLVEVKPTCTTPGYSDCDSHSWCDCGAEDTWEHIHHDFPALGHSYNHIQHDWDLQEDADGNVIVYYEDVCGNCGQVGSSGWELY